MLFFYFDCKSTNIIPNCAYPPLLLYYHYCFFFLWTLSGAFVVGVWQGGGLRRFFSNSSRVGKNV